MSFFTSRRKARLTLITAAVGACVAAFTGNALAANVSTTPQLEAALAGSDPVINLAPGNYTPSATLVINRSVTLQGPASGPLSAGISGAGVTTGSPSGINNVIRILAGNTVTIRDINVNTTNASTDNVIDNEGTLNLEYSSVSVGSGPGVVVRNGGVLNSLNSTIADNAGIGVSLAAGGAATLRSTTVTNNASFGISAPAATTTLNLVNSLINSPTGSDCSAVADSVVFSYGSDATPTCAAAPSAGGLITGAANVAPIALNAPGSTFTAKLNAGSAAIDAGASGANCPADDQRHVARPGGAACDIGAFEVNTVSVSVPADFSFQATGLNTAVPFTATASNPENGAPLTPTCTAGPYTVTGAAPNFSVSLPAPFPVVAAPVTCTATNGAQSASRTFNVTVIDQIAPTFTSTPTDPQTAASNDGNPVSVTFTPAAAATDAVDGAIAPVCHTGTTSGPVVVSGASFPVGTTTVFCVATDAHGNFTTISFSVAVTDNSSNSTTVIDSSDTGANVSANGQIQADRNITTTIAVSSAVNFGRITMGPSYNAHTPVDPFVRVSTNAVNGYDLFVTRTVFSNANSPFFNTANATPQGSGSSDDIPLRLQTVLAAPGTSTNPLIGSSTQPVAAAAATLGLNAVPVGTPLPVHPSPPVPSGPGTLFVGSRDTFTLEAGDTWTTHYTLGPLTYAPSGPTAAVVTYTATVHP